MSVRRRDNNPRQARSFLDRPCETFPIIELSAASTQDLSAPWFLSAADDDQVHDSISDHED